MGIGKKLAELIDQKGINANELAESTGITPSTIYSIIKRDNTKVDIEVLIRICEALDVNVEIFYQEYMKNKKASRQTSLSSSFIDKYNAIDDSGRKMVDTVLELEYERCTSIADDEEQEIEIKHSYYKVSAGTGFDLGNDDEWETISIPDSSEARKADFALTIQGNSMEPVYFDGDIVLVKEQAAIDIGQVGIFTIEGEGYIKKYGGDRLISLNAEYEDIVFAEHDEDRIRCIGKVIGRI